MRRLADFCYRRRRLVAGFWVLLLVGLTFLNAVAGGTPRTEFGLPGSESQAAIDLLQAKGFTDRAGQAGTMVIKADGTVDDPAVRSALEDLFAKVEAQIPETTIASPYAPGGERQISSAKGRTIAYAEMNFAERSQEQYLEDAKAIRKLVDAVQVPGLTIELGGDQFASQEMPASELIGLIGAIIILLIAFGSLLAMGLPVVTALFGIGTGVALLGLAKNFIDMPNFTEQVGIMIGIGVGIDYALFIVTRYRQALRDGRDPHDAVSLAMDTAGRAVLFAGITVVIALLGMVFMGMSMMNGMAIGASLAVLMTMLAAVTLLPAILGFVGKGIDHLGLPHRKAAEGDGRASIWYRWSRVIQRYPWPAAIGGLAVLVVLGLPGLALTLGFGDAGNRPTGDTTRRAYDLLAEGFGPGFNGPLLVAAETPGGDKDREVVAKVADALRGTPGVAFVSPPILNQAGDAAILQVYPTTAPQDGETVDLVHSMRDQIVPGVAGASALEIHVGGLTAGAIDFSSHTASRLPVFFGAVLGLSFLLLLLVFRSLLVPIKAVIMNLLSIGAAFGVLVAIFQWGWGASLIGVGKEGPIEAWAPMMLFAIVFGLSMDYEVFLLSRIREEYDRTGDNGLAVADGLAATARVITAAAAIMVVVFLSFVLGHDRSLKLMGLGLALAVFLDATIVRLVLVPATMELLGNRNWWLPAWLGRALPVIHVEAVPEPSGSPAGGGGGGA